MPRAAVRRAEEMRARWHALARRVAASRKKMRRTCGRPSPPRGLTRPNRPPLASSVILRHPGAQREGRRAGRGQTAAPGRREPALSRRTSHQNTTPPPPPRSKATGRPPWGCQAPRPPPHPPPGSACISAACAAAEGQYCQHCPQFAMVRRRPRPAAAACRGAPHPPAARRASLAGAKESKRERKPAVTGEGAGRDWLGKVIKKQNRESIFPGVHVGTRGIEGRGEAARASGASAAPRGTLSRRGGLLFV